MSNSKIFIDRSTPPRDKAPSAPAKEGIVLASASYDAEGDKGRDEKVNKAIEAAGYEPPPPELPPVDDSRGGHAATGARAVGTQFSAIWPRGRAGAGKIFGLEEGRGRRRCLYRAGGAWPGRVLFPLPADAEWMT